MTQTSDDLTAARELIELEGIYLDEKRWDEWLELYTPDCEYWLPAWKGDGTLTSNPHAELSHIYYASRRGLEDRLVRIKSRASPVSHWDARTMHMVSAVRLLDSPSDGKQQTGGLYLRASWQTQVFFANSHVSACYFGRCEYTLTRSDGPLKIARKKIILQNDYAPTIIDIYCL